MKRINCSGLITILLIAVLIPFSSAGQNIKQNLIASKKVNEDRSLIDELLALALKNNPSSRMNANLARAALEDYRQSKVSWFDPVNLSFNLNEGNIDRENSAYNYFYPRYNLGVNFNLGSAFARPSKTKHASILYDNALEATDQFKIEMRNKIEIIINDMILNQRLYQINNISLADANSNLLLVTEKFKNGETSLAVYNEAIIGKNIIQADVFRGENVFMNLLSNLESLIGVPIENVKNFFQELN